MRLLVLLAGVAATGCGASSATPSAPPSTAHLSGDPLRVGDTMPGYGAAGWINGPPATDPPAVTLVDVWGNWCPFCRATAPGLVKLYDTYKPRGVRFVSLTGHDEESVRHFTSSLKVEWPSGFGLSAEALSMLGSFRPDQTVRGYEAAPTFYVVARDGKIVWTDNRARMRHRSPDEVCADLTKALDDALAPGK